MVGKGDRAEPDESGEVGRKYGSKVMQGHELMIRNLDVILIVIGSQ